MLHRPLLELDLGAAGSRGTAEQLGQPALVAHLDHDRAQPPLGGEQAERGGHRRLADAALAGDHEQLAFEQRCHRSSAVCLKPRVTATGLDLQSSG